MSTEIQAHISDAIRYIGADDPSLHMFENQYPLEHGMSYNSYLVLDRQVALLDTIDERCRDEWMLNLTAALQGREPDYLVVHHMEPDHSAALAEAMRRWPRMTLVASRGALAMLPQFFGGETFEGRTRAVKEGDVLELGERRLQFIAAPMVHWPEVMMSYEPMDRVLFSADAFGKFGALDYHDDWANEARRYYANIVGKYGPQVQAVLRKVGALPGVGAIAPLHGPVLSGDLQPCLSLYDAWSSYRPEQPGVLVAYATIYGGTGQCARLFAEMLRQRGVEVIEIDLSHTDVSEAVAQAFRLPAMLLASPTYDAGLYPAMYHFLHHLQLKNLQRRAFGLIENGSWAPMAGRLMAAQMEQMRQMTQVGATVTLRSRMHPDNQAALDALADALAEASRI